jgi:heme exporter protein CcmD
MGNHMTFVIAAFGVAGIGMAWLIIASYAAMRKSEALADDLRQNRP